MDFLTEQTPCPPPPELAAGSRPCYIQGAANFGVEESRNGEFRRISASATLTHWTRCMVLWDCLGGGVCNVLVVEHPATVDYPQTFSDGACWRDWPTGKRRPADLFGALLEQGFTNPAEMCRALAEVAKVAGCGWAKRMLTGLKAWRGDK